MSTTLRCVIAGTGAVAHLHAEAIALIDDVELVAAFNPSLPKLEAFAQRHGVPTIYRSYEEMVDVEQPDIVILCSPPGVHKDQSIYAMRAGSHVVCEKPACLSLAEFDDIAAESARTGKAFAVVFQQRTGSALDHVRELIRSGELGAPRLALCDTLWFRDGDYYSVAWRGSWDTEGGGTTFGHGVHQIDLMADLLGPWTAVHAIVRRVARPTMAEDVSLATIEFASGALASVVTSVLSPRQTSRVRIDTDRASIELEHLYGHDNDSWTITPAPNVSAEESASWQIPQDTSVPAGHEPLLLSVCDAIRRDEPVPFTGESAHRAMEIVAAIYASAASGHTITPADLGPDSPFYGSMRGDTPDGWPGTTGETR